MVLSNALQEPGTDSGNAPARAAEESDSTQEAGVVRLPPAKIESAGIQVRQVEVRDLQPMRTVPGTIGYNGSRRVELKTPVDCTVRDVLVEPGQTVRKGQPLAILTSPEVGLARSEAAHCESDLALASAEHERATEIATNLAELIQELNQRAPVAEMERRFADRTLGKYRQTVLSAYSKLIAAELAAAGDSNATGLSGRVREQRRSNLEIANAEFRTACDQSLFESARDRAMARAEAEHAQRLLAVAQQRLESFGSGIRQDSASFASASAADGHPAEAESSRTPPRGGISDWTVQAPIDGIVEERWIVPTARLAASQPIVALTNTESLWVTAEVFQRDWHALALTEGQTVLVRSPYVPGHDAEARVRFASVSVSPETRSVPLVAEFDNPEAHFRPGMFAWISLPLGTPRRGLAVPAGAVMRHEGQAMVFIEQAPGVYRKANVETGLETPEWIEITAGVRDGETVVAAGAFFLKAELLLEREE
jgi:RND family efflux transporter MFP subunit